LITTWTIGYWTDVLGCKNIISALERLNCSVSGLWLGQTVYIQIFHVQQISVICFCTYKQIGWGGMDWIDLAHDRDQWRALVNMVMNLWVP
jgi:hypothetical protein